MKKVWLFILPLVVILYFLFGVNSGVDEKYIQEVKDYWEDRHEFFRTSTASPFVERNVAYKEVEVFPIDADFKVKGKLDRYTQRELVKLSNSDGTIESYVKYAWVRFKLRGNQHKLLILKSLGFGAQYLLAFGDATSGDTTYGGGRYLDVSIGKSDELMLDFNKAYNPYCAYFEDYTCPLPPVENLLEVSIPAGEKDYEL